MAEDFYAGYYDAVVQLCFWIESSKKKTLGLNVSVIVRNAMEVEKAMEGTIWFSKGTMKRPDPREDGTQGRSMAERQVNAIGYEGPFRDARNIRPNDLQGKPTRVQLKEEEFDGQTTLKISFFCEKGSGKGTPAKMSDVEKLFAGLGEGPSPQSQPATPAPPPPQTDEPPPPEPPDSDDDIPF